MKKNEILKITISAIMAAVSIVLEKFVSIDWGMGKLTFHGFPLMLVGLTMGVKTGFLTGLVVGAISELTSKYGLSVMSIFWALGPIFWGTISAITYKLFKKNDKLIYIVLVVLITSVSVTMINSLTMIITGLIYGDEYYALANVLINLPTRLLSMIILVIPYSLLLKCIKERINFIDR